MNNNRFIVYTDVAGQYRWYLQARNGEKVAASEAYTSKQAAINSAYRVKQIAWSAIVVDHTT